MLPSSSTLKPLWPKPLANSLGTRLFLAVLGAAIAALGGTSYLTYRALEHDAHTQIQNQIHTQTTQIEAQLGKIEAYSLGLAIAVQVNHQAQVTQGSRYEQLAFESFKHRPELIMAIGFGQTPYALQPEREWIYHYFYLDQGADGAKGRFLQPPYQNIRYSELFADDNYPKQVYYQRPTESGEAIWVQPYDWYGITMTSFMQPIVSPQGKILGVVGADVNVTALSQLLKGSVLQQQGHYLLLSEEGNLLAYPPDPGKAKANVTYKAIPGLTQIWQQAQQQAAGLVQLEGQIWAYRRIQGTQWLMVATLPQSAVIQPILISTAVGMLGAGTFLAIAVALFVRRLNQRLQPIVAVCYHIQQQYAPSELEQTAQPRQTGDELTVLAVTVEQMSQRLNQAFAELAQSNEMLEARVTARTEELSQALQHLQTTQLQMIQSEKMSALGNLVAGVAHEINNPVNFLDGNLEPAQAYVQDLLGLIDLYQSEYPAPNPAIDSNIQAIELNYLRQDLQQLLGSMQTGIDRIRGISQSLRTFSRADTDRPTQFNLHEGLDSTLLILKHRLKANRQRPEIKVHKHYGEIPTIEGFAGQLNQVFMNILANAIDALDEGDRPNGDRLASSITIITKTSAAGVIEITIADNGSGMSDQVRSQVFDHLFTTKPVGQGTGLGLSIAHQIMTQKHQGTLRVKSTLGQGSSFILTLPQSPSTPKASSQQADA